MFVIKFIFWHFPLAKVFCGYFWKQETARCVGWQKFVFIQMHDFKDFWNVFSPILECGRERKQMPFHAVEPATSLHYLERWEQTSAFSVYESCVSLRKLYIVPQHSTSYDSSTSLTSKINNVQRICQTSKSEDLKPNFILKSSNQIKLDLSTSKLFFVQSISPKILRCSTDNRHE